MHIRVLGSFGSRIPGIHTSSLLLNKTLLVDAGTITSVLGQDELMAIEDVLLTPSMLAGELVKFDRPEVPVGIFHIKPQFLDELRTELAALNDPRLQILYGDEEFQLC